MTGRAELVLCALRPRRASSLLHRPRAKKMESLLDKRLEFSLLGWPP